METSSSDWISESVRTNSFSLSRLYASRTIRNKGNSRLHTFSTIRDFCYILNACHFFDCIVLQMRRRVIKYWCAQSSFRKTLFSLNSYNAFRKITFFTYQHTVRHGNKPRTWVSENERNEEDFSCHCQRPRWDGGRRKRRFCRGKLLQKSSSSSTDARTDGRSVGWRTIMRANERAKWGKISAGAAEEGTYFPHVSLPLCQARRRARPTSAGKRPENRVVPSLLRLSSPRLWSG